ncbi:hypothetical protein Tco_0618293 [Tanacetum coccineum]
MYSITSTQKPSFFLALPRSLFLETDFQPLANIISSSVGPPRQLRGVHHRFETCLFWRCGIRLLLLGGEWSGLLPRENARTSNPETRLAVTRKRETRVVAVPVSGFRKVGVGKELWSLLAKWWDLDIPMCGNIAEWHAWLGDLHVSSKVRLAIEGVGVCRWSLLHISSFLAPWLDKRGAKFYVGGALPILISIRMKNG